MAGKSLWNFYFQRNTMFVPSSMDKNLHLDLSLFYFVFYNWFIKALFTSPRREFRSFIRIKYVHAGRCGRVAPLDVLRMIQLFSIGRLVSSVIYTCPKCTLSCNFSIFIFGQGLPFLNKTFKYALISITFQVIR